MFRFHPKILDTLPGYDRGALTGDIAAGITVGVLALPLAMAFAIASGMSPAAGIWTAIVAGLLISVLGGSRVQIGGPTGAFIPIVYVIVLEHGVANLLIATMMAGVLLFAMGALKLGTMVRFIPVSVVIGFTNGIAVVIFISQIKDFLGLQIEQLPGEFFAKMEVLTGALNTLHPATVALSVGSVAVLIGWNVLARHVAWMRRMPGPLAVLVLLAMVLVMAPLASHIPLATLSAIVVIVAINMGEWHALRPAHLARHSRSHAVTLLTTFAVTVLFDLTLAVQVGLVMSALVFLFRMSDLTRLDAVDLTGRAPENQLHRADGSPRILAWRLEGSLFFGATNKLDALLSETLGQPDVVILDLDHMVHIDTTGLDILDNVRQTLNARGIRLMLAGLNPQPAELLSRACFEQEPGCETFAANLDDALARACLPYGAPA